MRSKTGAGRAFSQTEEMTAPGPGGECRTSLIAFCGHLGCGVVNISGPSTSTICPRARRPESSWWSPSPCCCSAQSPRSQPDPVPVRAGPSSHQGLARLADLDGKTEADFVAALGAAIQRRSPVWLSASACSSGRSVASTWPCCSTLTIGRADSPPPRRVNQGAVERDDHNACRRQVSSPRVLGGPDLAASVRARPRPLTECTRDVPQTRHTARFATVNTGHPGQAVASGEPEAQTDQPC